VAGDDLQGLWNRVVVSDVLQVSNVGRDSGNRTTGKSSVDILHRVLTTDDKLRVVT